MWPIQKGSQGAQNEEVSGLEAGAEFQMEASEAPTQHSNNAPLHHGTVRARADKETMNGTAKIEE